MPLSNIAGGIDKLLYGDEEDQAAKEELEALKRLYNNVDTPDFEDLSFEDYQYQGDVSPHTMSSPEELQYEDVDPRLAEATMQGDSEMQDISVDPRLKDAQLAALEEMQRVADEGGMTAQDEANLARIQSQAAQADRGRREAIDQSMQRRGMGGSGMDLLAKLQSNQAATDRQAQQGLDVAGMAQDRALQAMMQSGQLGGDIRGQEFGEQARIAQAQDAINRFNTANTNQFSRFNTDTANQMAQFNAGNQMQADQFNIGNQMQTEQYNTGALNQAGYRNRDAQQNISNMNTDIANQQQQANKFDIPQQQFSNEMQKAGGQAQGHQAMAGYWGDKDARKRDSTGNLIAGGAMIAASDEDAKKDVSDVKDVDLEEFLAKIDPKKYQYKDPKHGEGRHTGVMAQDLLKSDLGQEMVVQDEEGTLGYDTQKMQGVELAAIKQLADKIDAMEKKKK